jgi:hypothetical protein
MENESSNIKFKAIQYFSDPPMTILFSRLETAKADDRDLIILMIRIREALKKEGLIIDEAIKGIKERYISELSEEEEPSQNEINLRINNFLRDLDVAVPFVKIKYSQIKGIKSLSDLDALEGIIEVDIDEKGA